MQGSASPIVPSPSRTGDRGANTEIAPSRGIHGLLTGGLLTPVLPPLCALHLGDRSSTRPDRPKLRSSSDDDPRSVSYRLDTPTPLAVARRWRRLVSGSEEPSPLIRSPECTADVRFGWTLPRRCRHDSIPTDPARQETPGTIGTQNVPIGFAPQHKRFGRCTTKTPKGFPGARDLARTTAKRRPTSLRLPAHRACCHARCGTAS
jgi:hypothetical protein